MNSRLVGSAWRDIVAHCHRLSIKADAYYTNKRDERRAASVVKDLRFNNPSGRGYFGKRK